VVTEEFRPAPAGQPRPRRAAPLLCAGITTYSPLRHWKVGPGQKVGIVGLGGLGHMGVKFASAFGAHVVLFTTSPGKVADAKRLGAHEVVHLQGRRADGGARRQLRLHPRHRLRPHDINAYLGLLKRDGTLTLVGAPEPAAARGGLPADLIRRARNLRLAHRRHARDPGDAGFLRQHNRHERHRDDPHGPDQRAPTSACSRAT
jgi:uncharacterized zinc-type alcohol dehydrogenase-like protein